MTTTPRKKSSHAITTSLPIDEADAFRDYCKHIRRSEAWVAREAIRLYLTTVERGA